MGVPPAGTRAYSLYLRRQKLRRQALRRETAKAKARKPLAGELGELRRNCDGAASRATAHCRNAGNARLALQAARLELQTAHLHNRADKKKALEARRDAEACRTQRDDAREELRQATLRLASWESWWNSLSAGDKKKVQKVTRRPPKLRRRAWLALDPDGVACDGYA